MTKQVAIYARVSTGEQTPDNQLRELLAVAARMGWQVVEEFVDHGISGVKGRDRPMTGSTVPSCGASLTC
jgi:DNA invertase Pin-like site-specific DNA recombinase